MSFKLREKFDDLKRLLFLVLMIGFPVWLVLLEYSEVGHWLQNMFIYFIIFVYILVIGYFVLGLIWKDNPTTRAVGWVKEYFKDREKKIELDDIHQKLKYEKLKNDHPEIYNEFMTSDGSLTQKEAFEKMDEVERQEKINDGSYIYELSEEELQQEWEEEIRNMDDGT